MRRLDGLASLCDPSGHCAMLCRRRTDNLTARANAKLAKRKDKREKKLMRAGFEGRRDTFINS